MHSAAHSEGRPVVGNVCGGATVHGMHLVGVFELTSLLKLVDTPTLRLGMSKAASSRPETMSALMRAMAVVQAWGCLTTVALISPAVEGATACMQLTLVLPVLGINVLQLMGCAVQMPAQPCCNLNCH